MAGTGNDKELVILAQFTDVAPRRVHRGRLGQPLLRCHRQRRRLLRRGEPGSFGLKPAAETCGTPNDGVTNWITLPYAHPNTGLDAVAPEHYVADAIKAAEDCVDYAVVRRDERPARGRRDHHRRAARDGHRRGLRDVLLRPG